MSKTWAEEHAERVARAVKALRGKRSGQWLSDRTAEAGHRVSRTTLSELENGKRKHVTTAELFVLAWALEVPPALLLFPDMPDGEVEVVPGRSERSAEAAAWLVGRVVFEHDPGVGLVPALEGTEPMTDDQVEAFRRLDALDRGRQVADLSLRLVEIEKEATRLARSATKMREEGEEGKEGAEEFAKAFFGQVSRLEDERARTAGTLRQLGAVVKGSPGGQG